MPDVFDFGLCVMPTHMMAERVEQQQIKLPGSTVGEVSCCYPLRHTSQGIVPFDHLRVSSKRTACCATPRSASTLAPTT